MDQVPLGVAGQHRLGYTRMWLSMPQRITVLRLPGSRFGAEQNTSLPKQENICFSMRCFFRQKT